MEIDALLLREALTESLHHTLSMVPMLFGVFLLMEFVSHGTKADWVSKVTGHRVAGPLAASALGLLPQCGFSVATTLLWTQGMIPTGSLVASYIATSDEAIPLLLSDPSTTAWVLPLMAAKLVWGAAVGIVVNLASRSRGYRPDLAKDASAGHELAGSCVGEKAKWSMYMPHALSRTARTAAMVFVLSSAFDLATELAGARVAGFLTGSGLWQPFAASVLGLIPSCATSVALAEGFRSGLISFPALLSGLTANAGMGVLVLVRESKNLKKTSSVVVILIAAAFVAGCLANLILPA